MGKDSRDKRDKQAKSLRSAPKSAPSDSSLARGRRREDEEARSLFVKFGIPVIDPRAPDIVLSQLSAQSASDGSPTSHKSRRHNGNRRSPPDRSITRSQESQGSQGEESTHHTHSESSAVEARQVADRVQSGRISRRELGKVSTPAVVHDQELHLDDIMQFSEGDEEEQQQHSIHSTIRKRPRIIQSASGSEYELSQGEGVAQGEVQERSRESGGMRAVAPQTQFHADFHGKQFALQISRKLKGPVVTPSGAISEDDLLTSEDDENNRRPKVKPSVAVPSPVEKQQDPDLIALALASADNLWVTLAESDGALCTRIRNLVRDAVKYKGGSKQRWLLVCYARAMTNSMLDRTTPTA
ncbi:hypothetical protein B484DRAFT_473332, partial [Ochromonadaceae sp. CCMP2298]